MLRSAAFFFVGTGLEAGIGPAVITGGFQRGDGWLDNTVALALGLVLIVAGAAIVTWCYVSFVRGAGTPSPLAPPRELVGAGPYGVVRNPMYLATAVIIVGEGLLIARPLLIGCALAYLTAMYLLVTRYEEPLLARRFGAAWDAYAERVPGWVPSRRGT